jgi:hypothetical protein
MTRAQAAAWNVYAARVTTIFQSQHEQYAAGESVPSITIAPPTKEHVEIIQKAIDLSVRDAQLDIIKAVLTPAYEMLDAIDNSRTKSESVKALRAELQRVYDELHTLKAASEKAIDAMKAERAQTT